MSKALVAAGCFWGIEEYFRKLHGIISTKVGYSGGFKKNPTYEEVCTGSTGHAEVVLINYNIKLANYEFIVENFWKCHDPTQLNRQGPDIGTQYRSVIFYFDNEQKKIAELSKAIMQKKLKLPIVTSIEKAQHFYLAEDYHQCFIKKRA